MESGDKEQEKKVMGNLTVGDVSFLLLPLFQRAGLRPLPILDFVAAVYYLVALSLSDDDCKKVNTHLLFVAVSGSVAFLPLQITQTQQSNRLNPSGEKDGCGKWNYW